MIPIFVFTCDKYLWALRPFAYLFNAYWPDSAHVDVDVVGYARPQFALPANFIFHSMAANMYPANRWSNGILEWLSTVNADMFVFMLEDYWLIRGVDVQGIRHIIDYMRLHQDIYRVDLTGDRLYSTKALETGESAGHIDLVETPWGTEYNNSIQACVYNKTRLMQIMRPETSPWDFELYTQIPQGLRVLGTKQMPIKYTIGIGSGHGDKHTDDIPKLHFDKMRQLGYL